VTGRLGAASVLGAVAAVVTGTGWERLAFGPAGRKYRRMARDGAPPLGTEVDMGRFYKSKFQYK